MYRARACIRRHIWFCRFLITSLYGEKRRSAGPLFSRFDKWYGNHVFQLSNRLLVERVLLCIIIKLGAAAWRSFRREGSRRPRLSAGCFLSSVLSGWRPSCPAVHVQMCCLLPLLRESPAFFQFYNTATANRRHLSACGCATVIKLRMVHPRLVINSCAGKALSILKWG